MSLGCLRGEVIYPDSRQDMISKGITDEDLEGILRTVHLNYIVKKEGGQGVKNCCSRLLPMLRWFS